jgi:hypothetical protein
VKRSKTKPKQAGAKSSRKTTRTAPKKQVAAPQVPTSANDPYVSITERDVILLQTTNHLGTSGLQDLVFQVFSMCSRSRRPGTEWLAFSTSDRLHHANKSSWIGLSKSIPLAVIDAIQAAMKDAGLDVEREMGLALHLDMNPFARLSDDGLEILVPAALAGDPHVKRLVERGGTSPVARGYTIQPSKAAALNQLFFGSRD